MSNITALTISSGNVAYCGRRNQFILDNVLNGFDLYELVKGKARRLHNFRTRVSTVPLPKQVTFCEDDKIVIGGSDHGKVYAFDRRSGQNLDELPHEDGGMVQTISVRRVPQLLAESNKLQARDTPDGTLVGAATSADRGRISISIWMRKKSSTGTRPKGSHEREWTIGKVLWTIMQTVMIIASLTFVYESLTNSVSPASRMPKCQISPLAGCYSRLYNVCYGLSTRYA